MINQVLVKKYARGLVEASADEAEFRSLERELRAFSGLLESDRDIKQTLIAPFLHSKKRAEILTAVVEAAKLSDKAGRFLSLLLEHKRLDILSEIVDALEETWNETAGVESFTVTSAFPLSEAQKKKLAAKLEGREKKPVRLAFALDPEVIGGISLKRGHIVYDASVAGNILKLKQLIQQG